MRRVRKILLFLSVWFFSACGSLYHSTLTEKAYPAPAMPAAGAAQITLDTILNMLSNSLVELILLLIAVIMFLRFKASHRKKSNHEPNQFKNSLHLDGPLENSAWHFDEDEKKN